MTCAKTKVTAMIICVNGKRFIASNNCRNPQPKCPRSLGEDYTKCKTICDQEGHAEMVVLQKAKDAGANVAGAHIVVSGHYHVCQLCAIELRDAGISTITIEVRP